jgi:SAM-dependent methyltransferase
MPDWDTLFLEKEHRWMEPHKRLGEFLERLPGKEQPRVLDIGSGAGRHVIEMARRGIKVVGGDISEVGLRSTQTWLGEEGLDAGLVRMDMTALPYPDESFDGVLSLYVIYHNPLASIRKSFAEIWRVLKPGGRAFVNFLSKRGARYGNGEEIETDTFLPDTGEDRGQPHHYSDLAEFDHELRGFIIQRVLLDESQEEYLHSHWEVFMEKPAG